MCQHLSLKKVKLVLVFSTSFKHLISSQNGSPYSVPIQGQFSNTCAKCMDISHKVVNTTKRPECRGKLCGHLATKQFFYRLWTVLPPVRFSTWLLLFSPKVYAESSSQRISNTHKSHMLISHNVVGSSNFGIVENKFSRHPAQKLYHERPLLHLCRR